MKMIASNGRGYCRKLLFSLNFVLGLVACGGGGGYSSATDRQNDAANAAAAATTAAANAVTTAADLAADPPGTVYQPARAYAAQCVSPRVGTNPATGLAYTDVQGSYESEKSWVRSWLNDTYLWYSEIPSVASNRYATAVEYFNVLKTPATTLAGAPKDKYHFTYLTPTWLALSQGGVQLGYGIDWVLQASAPPRRIVVSQVTPGSVAAQAGIQRGATVLTVDGVDVVNGSDVAAINAGLFPTVAGQSHVLEIKDTASAATRAVTLVAGPVTLVPVQNVKVIASNGGSVGYMLFNDHMATAESPLIDAITQLKAANVTDLVLDMRYNGGGFLGIAAELAYMIAGPSATQGKVFEKLNFNDKNPFNLSAADTQIPFYDQAQGYSATRGQPLPYLGLRRVYVLSSSRTCSASESVINGLRGAGIEVNVVGGTTCGKPYGFTPTDNCGVTYFAVQFQGTNHLGFGDYADGFKATCQAFDDYTRQLGDPAEGQLSVALSLRRDGVCPDASLFAAVARTQGSSAGVALTFPENPARNNRLLR